MPYLRHTLYLLLILSGLGISRSANADGEFTPLNVSGEQSGQIRWGDLAIDDSNRAHLIWVRPEPSPTRPGKFDHHLLYRIANLSDSSQSAIVDLTREEFRIDGLPAIACNSDGRTAIVAYAFDNVNKVNGSFLWTFAPEQLNPERPLRLGAGEKVQGRCGIADVAVARDGNIIVAYATPNLPDSSGKLATTVWYEIFDSQGRPIREPTQAGSGAYSYSRAANACIAVNDSGRFVIAWNANLQEKRAFFPEQVFARVYDRTGSPITGEILVSCEGPAGSCRGDTLVFVAGPAGQHPAVAISTDGTVAIAFRNTRYFECTNEYFVLRRFNPDGTPAGKMEKINDLTECGASAFPAALAFDRSGCLLAAWTNNNLGGEGAQSSNAYYQWYDKAGLRLGSNKRIGAESSTSNNGCDWRVACDINWNGHVAISTACNYPGSDGRQLLLHFSSISSLEDR